MTFLQWAKAHRLPVRKAADGSDIIPGRSGSIWDYGHGLLGVTYEGDTVGKWNSRRAKAKSVGLIVTQNGDTEGNMWFDPASKEQSAFAIKVSGTRPRRNLTPEARKAIGRRLHGEKKCL